MAKYCMMCGDRLSGDAGDRCQICWDMHTLIQRDVKLAGRVYDKFVLEELIRRKPTAFRQTLVELE